MNMYVMTHPNLKPTSKLVYHMLVDLSVNKTAQIQTTTLAKHLHISTPTITNAAKELDKEGLIKYEPSKVKGVFSEFHILK